MDHVECIVVGAGVVGLAIARELAMQGREVVVVESNVHIGEETSSRSNEVVHAGFLYPPGSLKERMCLKGRDMLYAYCDERQVACSRIGKLVPALDEAELALLEKCHANARRLGIEVELLGGNEVRKLEPNLHCEQALFSPISGIVDSHGLMVALMGDAQVHGATVALGTTVVRVEILDSGAFRLEFEADGATGSLTTDIFVNSAGLGAHTLARRIEGFPVARVPAIHFAKGSFFSYQGKRPFDRLVMPLGNTLWRGGAFTLDLAGQGRFGPDLEWPVAKDYTVDPDAASSFVANISRYWPGISAERLSASYAGIRPRTSGPGEPVTDWCIQGEEEHGIRNLVHLFAIETPGLTSCLATAQFVARKIH